MPFLIKTHKQGLLVIILLELLLLPSLTMAECNNAITATTAHLIDNHDGTVSDPKTGLIWKKCSVGQSYNSVTNGCDGTARTFSWQGALHQSDSVWRVPNIKELRSIVELSCFNPAINEAVFPDIYSGGYWSSSQNAGFGKNAWIVKFNYGRVQTSTKIFSISYSVRLVRSGQ